MDFATTRQAPSDQLALDLNLSGDVMTDTMAGVEPWMQEMLNEHFFSPTAQELTSEMAPSTVAVNDMAWMNPQALPAPVGNFDFSLTPNDQLLAADVSQNSFNSSTDLDFDLSEFLTEPATAGQQMVSNEVFGEQNFGALPEFPSLEATQEDHSQSAFDHVASAIRELARARATADPRPLSRKQKQSDASIALYLERLRDACDDAVAVITSSNTSNRSESSSNFHSPDLGSLQSSFHSEYVPQTQGHGIASASNSALLDSFTFPINSHQSSPQDSLISFTTSASTPNSESPTQQQQPAHRPVTGGIEMVMDLNMNAATTLPRRHRPRTQAQREQYLAVRNRGACEKHKRQHKRCTCVDKELVPKSKTKQNAVLKRQLKFTTPQSSNVQSQVSVTSNYSPASSNLSVECTQWCVAGYLGPDQCECIDCKEHIRQQLLRVHSRDRLVGRPQRPAVDPNKLKKQPNSENCQSQRLTRSAAGSDKSRYSPHEVAEATAQTTTDRSDSTYPSYGHHSRATRRTLSSLTEHKQSASTGDFGRVPTSIDQLTRKGHCGGTEIADKKYQQRTTPNGQQSTTKDASQRTTQNAQKVRTTPSSRGCSRVLRQPSHSQNSSALSGNSSSLTTSSLRAVVKRTPPLEDRASPMGRLSSIRQHTHTGDSRDYRGHLHSRRKDSLKVVAQMRVLSSQVVVPNLHAFGTPIRVIFACAISTCTPLRKIVSRCRILEGKRSFVTDFTTWMIIWAGLLLASILFKGSLG